VLWLCVLIVALALAFFGRDTLRSLVPRSSTRGASKPRMPTAESRPAMTAAWLLAECDRLAASRASWNEIATALNPEADSEVEALLGRLRAAHDGATPAILHAIGDGCRAALADNGDASGFDALSVAARNNQWSSSAKL
jgi:hypothetical protein